MNKKFIFPIFFCFFMFTSFVDLSAQWARTYGGSDYDFISSVQQTNDGGYIVIGYTYSFGVGEYDAWVLKLASNGDIEWQKTYGGSENDLIYSIQQTSDGGYIVAGGIYSFGAGECDVWVFKLASNGDIEWQKTYGGSDDDYACFIQQTSDGGYIAVGYTNSFGAGAYDVWVFKLASNGDIEWQKTYGGSGDEYAFSIQQTSDGGYTAVGYTNSFGAGANDVWVFKLASNGDIEWQKTYGGSGDEYAFSIQQTSDGGYIAVGYTNSFGAGEYDAWVFKLDSNGVIEWQKAYGGSSNDWVYSIQQTSDGGYIVAGGIYSFGAGANDVWVFKLDSNGVIEWQKTYGGTDNEYAWSIQQTSDGSYIVANDTYSFGAGPWNLLILKLCQNGDIDSSCGFIESSGASSIDTSIPPVDSDVTPESTNISPSTSNCSTQSTNSSATLLCASEYTLTISAGTGGTTDPVPGTYMFDSGTKVTVKAIPDNEYKFTGWSGDASGEDNPITITMDLDKNIIADFKKKGGCFIATAAYGSPLDPHVKILQDFRDKCLMPNKSGREFVDLYYKYSPFAAQIIAKNKALKAIARVNLIPIIVFSFSMVHLGPLKTGVMLLLILIVPVFLVSFFRGKMRRRKARTTLPVDSN